MKIRLLPALLVLLVVALTTALGFWQLDRAHQKEARQHQLVAAAAGPVIDLMAHPTRPTLDEVAYHRVAVRGRFLAEHVVYLENRPYNDQPGFYVVMPLRLDDGRVVLVNRGWLPRNLAERTAIAPYRTPSGEVTLEGVARADATRLFELGSAPGTGNRAIRPNVDIAAYARETGLPLLPFVIMQGSALDDGLVRDWPQPAADVDRNYGYMLQWWGMALAALGFGLYAAWRAARPERESRAGLVVPPMQQDEKEQK